MPLEYDIISSTNKNISLTLLINLIKEKIHIQNQRGRSVRLFNYHGYEIIDDSDLVEYSNNSDKYKGGEKIIFFSRNGENFVRNNILRLYKTGIKLGEGGYGKVYLAKQIFSKELFAIKYLKCDSEENITWINNMYKEIEVLKKLSHPNIIKLINYCSVDNDQIALILEYGSGGTLKGIFNINIYPDHLKIKGYLTEEEVKEIFTQILDGVNYCHSRGIIHRDIKLENIIFAEEEDHKIKV